MAKLAQQTTKSNENNNNNNSSNASSSMKVKRTRKTVPRDSPPQRSSIYRGVTRFFSYLNSGINLSFSLSIDFFIFYFLFLNGCFHFNFQASVDREVRSSFVGQELLEWITKQERKTRFLIRFFAYIYIHYLHFYFYNVFLYN